MACSQGLAACMHVSVPELQGTCWVGMDRTAWAWCCGSMPTPTPRRRGWVVSILGDQSCKTLRTWMCQCMLASGQREGTCGAKCKLFRVRVGRSPLTGGLPLPGAGGSS